jgi:hypothetical protein
MEPLSLSLQVLQDPSVVVLLHIMMSGKGLEVTARGNALPVSEFLIRHCTTSWKGA